MRSMKSASTQRVSSNAGKDNEKVLAEFAYQPAAEGKKQNGEAKSVSKSEVIQLVDTSRVTTPDMPMSAACQAIFPSRLVLGSIPHCANLLLYAHVLRSQATSPISIHCVHAPSTSA